EKKQERIFDQIVGSINGPTNATEYSFEKVLELENELKSIERILNKQKIMYENDIIGIDELITKSTELREREKKINNELKNIKQNTPKNQKEIEYLTKNIESLWQHANDYERKQMITMIFSRIVIDTEDEYKRGSGNSREIIIVSAE
ncbi:hypothetical protein V7100_10285, partial [Priestia megaterium]|uniref:hypothetical protein n=1 Tax=Priestia megaterium TaxID=1404 RepID=UPI003000B230